MKYKKNEILIPKNMFAFSKFTKDGVLYDRSEFFDYIIHKFLLKSNCKTLNDIIDINVYEQIADKSIRIVFEDEESGSPDEALEILINIDDTGIIVVSVIPANYETSGRQHEIVTSENIETVIKPSTADTISSMNNNNKFEAVSIMAGSIAHDYNNALTAVLGNLTLAKLELESSDSSLKELLNDVEEGAMRIKELTYKLSQFSSIGRPNKRKTSVARVLDLSFRSVESDYHANIKKEITDDIYLINVDETQMVHAFSNMLNFILNSCEKSNNIVISGENLIVDNNYQNNGKKIQHGDYVVVSMVYMPDSDNRLLLEKDYNPFSFQNMTDDKLNLCLAYAVLNRHQGFVKMDVKDKTVKFKIYIPVEKTKHDMDTII